MIDYKSIITRQTPEKSLVVPPKVFRRSQIRIRGGALKLKAKTLAYPRPPCAVSASARSVA